VKVDANTVLQLSGLADKSQIAAGRQCALTTARDSHNMRQRKVALILQRIVELKSTGADSEGKKLRTESHEQLY
jgi:hypothetical protein